MTTVLEDNIHNFAVEGTSDDLDVPIKEKWSKKTSFANKNQNVKIFIGQYFVYKSQLEILKKDERRE